MELEDLIYIAREAAEKAQPTYSEYSVGVALETISGHVYTGANFEVVNYSNTIHAEETAMSHALMDGVENFNRLVVVTTGEEPILPCGMCRQTLKEFADDDLEVYALGENPEPIEKATLGELLPSGMESTELTEKQSAD